MEVAEIGVFSDPVNLAKTMVLCERLVLGRSSLCVVDIFRTPNRPNFPGIFALRAVTGVFTALRRSQGICDKYSPRN